MSDERTMILKMLKEEKITLEEAEALLQVIGESISEEEGSGFKAEPNPPQQSETQEQQHRFTETSSTARSEANEPGPEDETASAAAAEEHEDRGSQRTEHEGEEHEEKQREDEEARYSGTGSANFFGFDFGSFAEELKGSLGGIGDVVRQAMEVVVEVDIASEIERSLGKQRVVQEGSRSLDLDAKDHGALTLTVDLAWADITVQAGQRSHVTVEYGLAALAKEKEQAESLAESIELVLESREGGPVLTTKSPDPEAAKRIKVDCTISVPEGLNVQTHTESGDLLIRGLRGTYTHRGAVGDIALQDVAGPVSLEVTSGDVAISRCEGAVQITTLSGDVTGTLRLAHDRTSTIKSTSGDVLLTAEAAAGTPLIAESMSGDVRCSGRVTRRSASEHRWEGRFGSKGGAGGGPGHETEQDEATAESGAATERGLRVSTVSGDILVKGVTVD